MPTATADSIIDELNVWLTRLGNSWAHYILESNPYTTDRDKAAITALKEAAAEENGLLSELALLIERLDGVPKSGLPDPALAELNYLSYPYLLDLLIEETNSELARLSVSLSRAQSSPEATAFLEKFNVAKQAHLKKFQDSREKYKTA